MNGDAVGIAAVKIAAAKAALPFWEAFFKGILCNILVCLAAWLSIAGRSVADKVSRSYFRSRPSLPPAGFEHSVANMYLIPFGILVQDEIGARSAGSPLDGFNLESDSCDVGKYLRRRRDGRRGLFCVPPCWFTAIEEATSMETLRTPLRPRQTRGPLQSPHTSATPGYDHIRMSALPRTLRPLRRAFTGEIKKERYAYYHKL